MPFTPAPGALQCVVKATWAQQIPIRHVFHATLATPTTEPFSANQLAQAASRFAGAYAAFLTQISNVLSVQSYDTRDLSTEDGAIASLASTQVGGVTAATTGPYTCQMVDWATGFAGRSAGRTFLPGVEETVVDNVGQLTPARISALAVNAGQFLTFLTAPTDATHLGAPLALIILSTKTTIGPSPTRLIRPVIGGTVRPEVAILRRRRPS